MKFVSDEPKGIAKAYRMSNYELPFFVLPGVATANDFVGEVNKRKVFANMFRE